MIRIATVAVVALAAFDHFYLNGEYLRSVQGMVRYLLHFVVG
jgi:hypothetical protein